MPIVRSSAAQAERNGATPVTSAAAPAEVVCRNRRRLKAIVMRVLPGLACRRCMHALCQIDPPRHRRRDPRGPARRARSVERALATGADCMQSGLMSEYPASRRPLSGMLAPRDMRRRRIGARRSHRRRRRARPRCEPASGPPPRRHRPVRSPRRRARARRSCGPGDPDPSNWTRRNGAKRRRTLRVVSARKALWLPS